MVPYSHKVSITENQNYTKINTLYWKNIYNYYPRIRAKVRSCGQQTRLAIGRSWVQMEIVSKPCQDWFLHPTIVNSIIEKSENMGSQMGHTNFFFKLLSAYHILRIPAPLPYHLFFYIHLTTVANHSALLLVTSYLWTRPNLFTRPFEGT